MPAALRCPTCSAPLDLPPAHANTIRCPYCGAGVLLTERSGHVEAAASHERHTGAIAEVLRQLRAGSKIGAIKAYREQFGVGLKEAKDAVERLEAGQPAGAVPLRPTPAAAAKHGAAIGCVLMMMLLALVAGLMMNRGDEDVPAQPAPPTAQTPVTAPASPVAEQPAAEAGYAREVMRFGSEGTGAGRFEDARNVAVDGTGRIYVAEYSGGRVQVFDSAGTFVTQWMADPRMPLVDMAADRGGTVYIVQSGRIRRYEGATGKALGELPGGGSFGYEDVTVALDGSLWAVSQESVVHLSRDGAVQRTINIKEAVDEDASAARVAVAGTGDLYVLDQWKADVYHLNPAGRFVDRFGGGGFPPADDVAVDGRGRVFVSHLGSAVRVFDAAGQPLGDIRGPGVVFGITLNDRDQLFATARNDHAIVKYGVRK
ncbi:MAG TPA: hypothetical protein VE871_18525 [Longimicrobium sp.]|nr:hypothetical protein [Longimicrobium sp.]